MGATGSRSSPPTEKLLLSIKEYSKLMRAPVRDHHRDFIRFRDLWWDITVSSERLNEETGVSGSDFLSVSLFGVQNSLESSLRTDISIEILDKTGLFTVFQRESSRATMKGSAGSLVMYVRRSELEASSCIRSNDSFYVRCTIKERLRPSLLGNWFSSKPEVSGKVAMARSHTLTVDSLGQLKAALLPRECAYSTRFTVGGSTWYLKLNPTLAAVHLVRATKEDDETQATAEFSFTLEGAVNVKSGKMTHTFDRANPDCMFAYQLPEEPSTSTTDQLHVQCCVKVIPAVVPTAVPSRAATVPRAVDIPAAKIPAAVLPPAESVPTPLLTAMHGVELDSAPTREWLNGTTMVERKVAVSGAKTAN
ncbi:hypothetical protein ACQ4PT_064160 [Festuca glaucescens]